uniref:Tudor domain-containing protein n=1 Tax=Trichuris muris TaxID=70415 RepID=A0A5S6QNV4_TRIMR
MVYALDYKPQSALLDCGLLFNEREVYDVFIGCWISPVEFFVVFRYFEPKLDELQRKISDFYKDTEAPDDVSMIGEGTPCCVWTRNKWRRAVVLMTCGIKGKDFHVRLVDYGGMEYVRRENVRWLSELFIDMPPMAVECEMLGVNKNFLYRSALDAFARHCKRNKYFKLSYVTPFENKLFVRLFDHEMNDLFFIHFGEMIYRAEQSERQRSESEFQKKGPTETGEKRLIEKSNADNVISHTIVCDVDELLMENTWD